MYVSISGYLDILLDFSNIYNSNSIYEFDYNVRIDSE